MEITLGSTEILSVSQHAQEFVGAARRQQIFIDHNGNWLGDSSDAYWSFSFLVQALSAAVGEECTAHLKQSSGMSFEQFVGQVVLWWLPQRNHVGLLRAIALRAETYGVFLTLHWNQGRYIRPELKTPSVMIQVVATLLSFVIGVYLYEHFHLDQLFGFLCGAVGYVGSELYRRSNFHRFCGDLLCRSRIRGTRCDFCGGRASE